VTAWQYSKSIMSIYFCIVFDSWDYQGCYGKKYVYICIYVYIYIVIFDELLKDLDISTMHFYTSF
jgi:hypothetical protein